MWRSILNANFGLFLTLCVICAGLSAVFLLKGEDTSYFEFRSARSFGSSGVSALTYYFVWPKSQRETVGQNEQLVAVWSAMAGGPPSSDLADRMQQNIVLAIVFGTASAGLAIALWVAKLPPGRRRWTRPISHR